MCKTSKAHENWGNGVACSQEKLKPCTNNHVKDLIPHVAKDNNDSNG
jgi:hypothetical protein